MNFFKRHPRFWIAVWAIFGVGGLMMSINAVIGEPFDPKLLLRGAIGTALAVMMIGYLLPAVRKKNAQD